MACGVEPAVFHAASESAETDSAAIGLLLYVFYPGVIELVNRGAKYKEGTKGVYETNDWNWDTGL